MMRFFGHMIDKMDVISTSMSKSTTKIRSSACMAIKTCDPFQPMCATSKNDHQFFYSQCEMVRDTCLTGKDWKSDFLSHCNVRKL
ncbi:uncharacterized protein LOC117589007 isoform X5 [Drosophila guanche]|uniref:uncharacterized protein LOC117589007 isoform X5 n=1 Tax=Drosophila guanche TaxID=7266 RepID=UPI00147160B6|nr:uncharacterized protein LOC117589007 isoform X5 [Drosophila guanche]